MKREQFKEAGRAIYHDRQLRVFWCFFIFIAIICVVFK